ncbi:Scr1 family TA system antitoxin-like transcriptional regulator [Streptomyces sp. NBC_01613]|uniref:Scr1 family TA system antitoxin-like transcriptional regulator n=1 Tax=Streptomyces sp. NBC_01613 TaxID=2975896 RepID=UPI003866A4AA
MLSQTLRGYLSVHDFTMLRLNNGMPTSAQVDNAWSATSVSDKPREVGRFIRMLNALTALALPAEDTPAFLQQLMLGITK